MEAVVNDTSMQDRTVVVNWGCWLQVHLLLTVSTWVSVGRWGGLDSSPVLSLH